MEGTTYDFRKFILFLRHTAWLTILGTLLGAGIGYMVSTMLNSTYQTTTKIMITRAGQSQSSDFTTYLSDLQMTQTYVQLLTTETVLKTAADRLGITLAPEDIDVHAVEDTQVIVMKVENGDPQQAALIANTIIEVLMEQNEIIQSGHYEVVEASLRLQKMQIESAMKDLQSQIKQTSIQGLDTQKIWLESQFEALQVEKTNLEQEVLEISVAKTPENQLLLNQKNARLGQIQSLMTLYQNNYNELLMVYYSPADEQINLGDSRLALLTTTQALYQQYYVSILSELESIHLARLQNVPNIVQIETASIPEKPNRPIPLLNTVLGAAIGLVFMTGITFLKEALDTTLKTKDSVEKILGVPVVGEVNKIPKKKKNAEGIYIVQQPHSPVAEDIRLLRTNLELASTQDHINTILVTSPQEAEGKTTVAVNLAASISQTDKRVALLEADLRHPRLQAMLGLSNTTDINALITNQENIKAVGHAFMDLPNLLIIPAGEPPSNPAELLASEKMRRLLLELSELVDVVVIDSPPSFVADAQILASKVDAVLFVVRPGVTHVDVAQSSIGVFKRSGVRIMGVVMNLISRNQNDHYGRSKYLSPN